MKTIRESIAVQIGAAWAVIYDGTEKYTKEGISGGLHMDIRSYMWSVMTENAIFQVTRFAENYVRKQNK